MISRRSFLSILSAAAVSHTIDLDKLLWVPGAKTIFIPAPTFAHKDYSARFIVGHIDAVNAAAFGAARMEYLANLECSLWSTLKNRS